MPHAKPRLLVVRGPCRGQELVVSTARIKIGRGPDNDLALPRDPSVSRHHLTITIVDGGVRARDNGSGNGTLLNGEPLEGERILRHGDELEIGESVVRLVHTEPVGLSVPFVKTRPPRPGLARPLMLAAGAGALVAAWFVFGSGSGGQKPRAADTPPVATPAATPKAPPPVVISLATPDAPPPAPSTPEPAPRPRTVARAKSNDALARGDAAAESDPAAALAAYQEAETADARAGGSHAALIRAKIARTAAPAATAFLRDGKLEQARAACDLAERAGADVTRIRRSLEAAAARLFAEARGGSEGAGATDAPALYRRILRIVPPSSEWHKKALAELGESP